MNIFTGKFLRFYFHKNNKNTNVATLARRDICDSGGIQTHNLLIRSQMLYSVELRSQLKNQNHEKIL